MRVLVCGSRTYADAEMMHAVLHRLWKETPFSCLIEGGARGADTLAREWAQKIALKTETYPAQWDKHKRAAGPIRNKQMLDEGQPDLVVAFPRLTLDVSLGTSHMVALAKKAGVRTIVVGA